MPLRVSLVNLQKFTFHGCERRPASGCWRPAQKISVLAAGDDHRAHLGVLEAQPLDGVVQLDVDAQVVGVELELVAGHQAAVLVDVRAR